MRQPACWPHSVVQSMFVLEVTHRLWRREAAEQGFKHSALFQITSHPSWIFSPRKRLHPNLPRQQQRRDPWTLRPEQWVTRSLCWPRGGKWSKGSRALWFRIRILSQILAPRLPNQLQQRFVLHHPLGLRGYHREWQEKCRRGRTFCMTPRGCREGWARSRVGHTGSSQAVGLVSSAQPSLSLTQWGVRG